MDCTEDMESDDKSSESSDSDSSDISDDEENAVNKEENQKKISSLQQSISENIYTYNPHVELIKLLRENGEFEQLRAARECMSSVFPLSCELWLQWLTDEIKYSEPSEREKINSLFERAVNDYVSVPIWLEYVQYSIGAMGQEGGISATRDTFERALTAAGLNVESGSILWEAYREFEEAVLGSMQPQPGSVPSVEAVKQTEAQMARVTKLFHRQLSIPLRNMKNTYEEYKEWAVSDLEPTQLHQYKKALALLEERKPYETELVNSEAPHQTAYLSYIDFEMKNGDPVRMISICERALVDNCLQPEMWLKYIRYMEDHLKSSSGIVRVYERAIRNCPWSVEIWVGYLQILESRAEPHQQIVDLFNRALSSGFSSGSEFLSLWNAYLDYLRRRIRWTEDHEKELEDLRTGFEQAVWHLNQNYPLDGDPNCTLMQYWAFLEAKLCHNMPKARELWSTILQAGFSNQASVCLEYIRLERAFGDQKHCRKLFQRVLHTVSDWPESICEAYINFERMEGDLETCLDVVKKCEVQMKRVRERREKESQKEAELAEQKKTQRADKKKDTKKKQRSQQQASNAATPMPVSSEIRPYKSKSSQVPVSTTAQSVPDQPSLGAVYVRGQKRKLESGDSSEVLSSSPSTTPDVSSSGSSLPTGGFKVPPPPGFKPKAVAIEQVESPAKKLKVTEESETANKVYKDSCTAFVSNLDYSISREQLREIFSKVGEISEIRLIANFQGKSKGYAYIEYKDEFGAAAAMKLDREPVEGRPMFVSPCDRDRSSAGPKLKFNTGLEKNKLFVRGLPLTITKDELEKVFNEHGQVKEVRLVTYRNGTPKGLAYVEYENEASAAQAILKIDGLKMGESFVSVAISNPPARNTPVSEREQSFLPSLGGGKTETERGRARTQVALVPRAVQRPNQPNVTSRGAKHPLPDNGSTSETETSKSMSGMNNQDFRNMLLKK